MVTLHGGTLTLYDGHSLSMVVHNNGHSLWWYSHSLWQTLTLYGSTQQWSIPGLIHAGASSAAELTVEVIMFAA
jgi:hypothetical protein